MLRWGAYFVLVAVLAAPVQALTLGDCTRVTHISHGGEADHVDLGEGRVMWRDWWSQEGSSTDFQIVDCAPERVLSFRTAEANMNAGPPFDRTDDAIEIVTRHETGARAFATLERMAEDLKKAAWDVTITTDTHETCACAALYPALRGDKEEFRLQSI